MIKVLVIDDSPTIQKAVNLILDGKDYRVFTATTGHEGIKICTDEKPHVVLIDVGMTDIDGYSISYQIKESNPQIATILLCGTFDTVNERKYESSSANLKLNKPFEMQALLDAIARVIQVEPVAPASSDKPLSIEENKIQEVEAGMSPSEEKTAIITVDKKEEETETIDIEGNAPPAGEGDEKVEQVPIQETVDAGTHAMEKEEQPEQGEEEEAGYSMGSKWSMKSFDDDPSKEHGKDQDMSFASSEEETRVEIKVPEPEAADSSGMTADEDSGLDDWSVDEPGRKPEPGYDEPDPEPDAPEASGDAGEKEHEEKTEDSPEEGFPPNMEKTIVDTISVKLESYIRKFVEEKLPDVAEKVIKEEINRLLRDEEQRRKQELQ